MDSRPSHRFALHTTENSSGQLWIASILCLIYCNLVLIVRLHVKWRLYGIDDLAIALATALQLGGNIPLFIALKNGLGDSKRELNSKQVATMGSATFAAQMFFILALAASKFSVAALMLRIFTRDITVTRRTRIVCFATITTTVFWAIGSIVGTALTCSPADFVRNEQWSRCSTRLLQWQVTAAFDILTELLLLILPILFVRSIQMNHDVKTQVAVAFGFRLPLIAIAAVHLHYVSKYSRAANISQAMIPALILQQCELLWSIISATIPTLKKFMRTFSSGFGLDIDLDCSYGPRSGSHGNKTYIMRSRQRTESFTLPMTQDESAPVEVPENIHKYSLNEGPSELCEPCSRPQSGHTSHSSREMIIKRKVEWRISYEETTRPKSGLVHPQ